MSADKLIVVVMLVSLMLQSGLEVDRSSLRAALTNYPLLGRAFLANFILVPLVAVILVRALHVDEYIGIGILLMAVAPGVPFLPRVAGRKAGGSLSLALELTFLLPLISIVTVPLTVRLIFPPDTIPRLPFSSMFVTLVIFQLIPLLIGLAVSLRAPKVAEKLVRPLSIVILLSILALLVVVAPLLGHAIATVYGSLGLITALLVVLLSAGFGWLLGGADRRYRDTLTLATALRNIGLASLIATTNFKGTPVVAMVFSYFIIQFLVALIVGKIFVRTMKTPQSPAPATV